MSKLRSLKDLVHKWPFLKGRKPWVYGAFCLWLLLLAVAALNLLFGGAILNTYGKGRLERAFAQAYPGSTLQVGRLEYTMGTDRLMAQTLTIHGAASTLKAGRISLTGVGWLRLFLGKAAHEVLAKASLDAADFEMEFPQAHYRIHCKKLRADAPASGLMVEEMELKSTIKDEARFAADAFRTTRFHVVVPECRVVGLTFGELLQGKSYLAREIHLSRPALDALVNRDKPVKTSRKRPLMVHEALAAIGPPVRIANLKISDGHINYAERVVARSAPGILTFTEVKMDAEGITNRGGKTESIRLKAQGKLMDAGLLKVQMKIPLKPQKFSLQYAGSLSAMDLTRLDAFLDIAERTRIKAGKVKKVTFKVEVAGDQARGQVRATYQDLKIAVLDKKTDKEKGLGNRIASFVANKFTIQPSSVPNSMKEGKVDYRRGPNDTFIQVAWFSLRSGVLRAIHR